MNICMEVDCLLCIPMTSQWTLLSTIVTPSVWMLRHSVCQSIWCCASLCWKVHRQVLSWTCWAGGWTKYFWYQGRNHWFILIISRFVPFLYSYHEPMKIVAFGLRYHLRAWNSAVSFSVHWSTWSRDKAHFIPHRLLIFKSRGRIQ